MRLPLPLGPHEVFLKARVRYLYDIAGHRSAQLTPHRSYSSVDFATAEVRLRGPEGAELRAYTFRLDRGGRLRFRPLWRQFDGPKASGTLLRAAAPEPEGLPPAAPASRLAEEAPADNNPPKFREPGSENRSPDFPTGVSWGDPPRANLELCAAVRAFLRAHRRQADLKGRPATYRAVANDFRVSVDCVRAALEDADVQSQLVLSVLSRTDSTPGALVTELGASQSDVASIRAKAAGRLERRIQRCTSQPLFFRALGTALASARCREAGLLGTLSPGSQSAFLNKTLDIVLRVATKPHGVAVSRKQLSEVHATAGLRISRAFYLAWASSLIASIPRFDGISGANVDGVSQQIIFDALQDLLVWYD